MVLIANFQEKKLKGNAPARMALYSSKIDVCLSKKDQSRIIFFIRNLNKSKELLMDQVTIEIILIGEALTLQ
jgi:hypothetical protein